MTRNRGRPAAHESDQIPRRIVCAARSVFAEFGYAQATLRKIAARADVSHGTVAYHFAGKDELFEAAVEATAITVRRASREASASEGRPVDQLTALVVALSDLGETAVESRVLVSVAVDALRHSCPHDDVPPLVDLVRDELRASLTPDIGQGLGPGVNSESAGHVLMALVLGMSLYRGYLPEHAASEFDRTASRFARRALA